MYTAIIIFGVVCLMISIAGLVWHERHKDPIESKLQEYLRKTSIDGR